ncbi:MAG: hypothetical protein WCG97_00095 [bacterium]
MNLSIKHINPPYGLEDCILRVISIKERSRNKLNLVIQSALALVSFVAFFPLGTAVATAFANSSFSQYVSLLFSGDSALMTYWQELTISIFESLPVLSLILFLSAGIVFLYSLTRAYKNGRQFFLLKATTQIQV